MTDDGDKAPLLFVHGLGHAAWCWENWEGAARAAGHPVASVTLRGHDGGSGRLRGAMLGHYVDEVVAAATAWDRSAVLVGHSMGGLVVQRALGRYAARAAVLVAPVPAHPAVGALLGIARQHPLDALRIVVGGSLPLRPEYLFAELPSEEARRQADRCGPESALAQYQLIFHLPSGHPLGTPPVLVLATPDDRLVPIRGVRSTARRYGADLREFPGMGHDLMLDARWKEPLGALLDWLTAAGGSAAGKARS